MSCSAQILRKADNNCWDGGEAREGVKRSVYPKTAQNYV